MAKKMKFDFKKIAMNTLIAGGTGAVAQVASEAIDLKDPSIIDYGMIAAGIILPEVVKVPEMETAGAALTAVGAYRMSERNDLAGKLGFKTDTTTAATAGMYGNYDVIGSGWRPTQKVYTTPPPASEKKNETVK